MTGNIKRDMKTSKSSQQTGQKQGSFESSQNAVVEATMLELQFQEASFPCNKYDNISKKLTNSWFIWVKKNLSNLCIVFCKTNFLKAV